MSEPQTYEDALDERLKRALEQSQYRSTLLKQQEQLKLKLAQDLAVAKNGGTFKVTRELLNFVYMLVHAGEESAVLLDEHEHPIRVDDLNDFQSELVKRYLAATSEFLEGWTRLRRARTVGALLK